MTIAFVLCTVLNGAEYFVSPTEEGGTGSRKSPFSLAQANLRLKPGDTAVLLDGTYTGTPIAPAKSGKKGKPVTYRAANRRKAHFSKMSSIPMPNSRGPAVIVVNDRHFITIDGISAGDVNRWLMGRRCSHITLMNCHFERSEGWINCRFESNGDGIRILNNSFNEGTDLVSLDGGDRHLVEGNFFGDATHTSLVLLGVQRSVVRGNTLLNRRWRCMEVESQRHEPFRLSAYNVIENNTFDYSPCDAIQYAGNRSIIRRNTIRRCLTGMAWANYTGSKKSAKKRSPEAWHNESNRFYNNVITQCGTNDLVLKLIAQNRSKGIKVAESVSSKGYAMVFYTDMFNPRLKGYDCAYGDNIAINNIFYLNGNNRLRNDKKGPLSMASTQVAFTWNATPEFAHIHNNTFFSKNLHDKIFCFLDAVYLKPPEPRNRSITSFEKRYPKYASRNRMIDPAFVSPKTGDYTLAPESPCIDAGMPLTRTTQSGTGRVVQVHDPLYFTDGHGLQQPDKLRIGQQRITLISVDYKAKTLTIDQEITWPKDCPVSLDFRGRGVDLGRFEM